jgi:hypothetical protein
MTKRSPFPPEYIACCDRLEKLIPQWIEEKSRQRFLDLQWHRWGKVCFAAALGGETAKYLAASPDAIELLNWLHEQTGRKATLLQAKVVLEALGIKTREDNN